MTPHMLAEVSRDLRRRAAQLVRTHCLMLVSLLLACCVSAPALAIEVGCPELVSECPPTVLWMSGSIVRGDFEKIRDILLDRAGEVSSINLFGMLGGDVNEAMRIGRLINRLHIRTSIGYPIYGSNGSVIPDLSDRIYFPLAAYDDKYGIPTVPSISQKDAYCASACWIIWAGGRTRFGSAFLFAHDVKIRSGAPTTIDQFAAAYLEVRARLTQYAEAMQVSDRYMAYLASVPPSDDALLTPRQINEYFQAKSVLDDLKMLWDCHALYPTWDEAANLIVTPEQIARLAKCQEANTANDRLQAWRFAFQLN